jgi:hypothetical protein
MEPLFQAARNVPIAFALVPDLVGARLRGLLWRGRAATPRSFMPFEFGVGSLLHHTDISNWIVCDVAHTVIELLWC